MMLDNLTTITWFFPAKSIADDRTDVVIPMAPWLHGPMNQGAVAGGRFHLGPRQDQLLRHRGAALAGGPVQCRDALPGEAVEVWEIHGRWLSSVMVT